MNICYYCGEESVRPHCSTLCVLLDRMETPKFRKLRLDRSISEHPNFTAEMRTVLLAKEAMSHRTRPCAPCV